MTAPEGWLVTEQAVIGSAMIGGTQGVMALTAEDFQNRANRIICLALQGMITRGMDPDPITVGAELKSQGKLDGPGNAGGLPYLFELAGVMWVASNSWYYASQLRELTRVRLAKAMATELATTMGREESGAEVDRLLVEHADRLAQIPGPLDADRNSELPTIAELFEMEFEKRWLVPGLLGRRERVVLTAAEGLGKSVLSTGWAIALAAGLHPFTGAKLDEPKRVLLLDAENSPEQTQNRYRWVGERINALGGTPGWAKRIHHQIRPEGFDITGRDRAWFAATVAKASPDLIVMGPAYKMMGSAKTSDDAAILAFFAVLDEIRVKHDCALLIEAHSGHAKDDEKRSVRPFGSSVWLRWPEVGVGLRRSEELDAHEDVASVVDVVHWRGNREQRDWPALLKRGRDGELPWAPMDDNGYWQKAKASA